MTSARPIASCCCCPPDRSPPRRVIIDASTGNKSKIKEGIRLDLSLLPASATFKFSSTVSCGKMSRPCGTYPTPNLGRNSVFSFVTLCPLIIISPDSMVSSPMRHLSNVVFPTPLRPIRQVQLPLLNFRFRSHKICELP